MVGASLRARVAAAVAPCAGHHRARAVREAAAGARARPLWLSLHAMLRDEASGGPGRRLAVRHCRPLWQRDRPPVGALGVARVCAAAAERAARPALRVVHVAVPDGGGAAALLGFPPPHHLRRQGPLRRAGVHQRVGGGHARHRRLSKVPKPRLPPAAPATSDGGSHSSSSPGAKESSKPGLTSSPSTSMPTSAQAGMPLGIKALSLDACGFSPNKGTRGSGEEDASFQSSACIRSSAPLPTRAHGAPRKDPERPLTGRCLPSARRGLRLSETCTCVES